MIILVLTISQLLLIGIGIGEVLSDATDKIKNKIRYAGKKGKRLKEFESLEFIGEMILMSYRLALIGKNGERAEYEKQHLIGYAEKIKETGHGDKSFIVDYVAKNFK